MRIAVTGASGFLGWHVRCRAFVAGVEAVPIWRSALGDPARLALRLRGVEAVIHCAGVNRGSDTELVDGNLVAAGALVDALRQCDRPVRVVYANSVQAPGDTAYGTAKRKRSHLFPRRLPIPLPRRSDAHGGLVECIRTGTTGGQAFWRSCC